MQPNRIHPTGTAITGGPLNTSRAASTHLCVHKNSYVHKNQSCPVFSLSKSPSEEMNEVHLISPRTEVSPSLASAEPATTNKEDTMDAALMLTSMRALISKEISGLGAESPFLPAHDDLDVRNPRRALQKQSLPVISPRWNTHSSLSHKSKALLVSRNVSSARARTVSMDSPALPKSVNTSQYEKLFDSQAAARDPLCTTTDLKPSLFSQPNKVSFAAISPPSSPKLSPQTSTPLLSVPTLRQPMEKRKSCSESFALQSSPRKRQASKKGLKSKKLSNKKDTSSRSQERNGAKPDRVLKKKFSWKNYPELEHFLIANREEYLRHSALNYTMQQKQYNNRLTERLLKLADDSGYAFDEDDFSFVTVRDRIRCYFKSYVQSRKKRGVIIGYAARRAGLLTEEELEKSASVKGRIVVPSIEQKASK